MAIKHSDSKQRTRRLMSQFARRVNPLRHYPEADQPTLWMVAFLAFGVGLPVAFVVGAAIGVSDIGVLFVLAGITAFAFMFVTLYVMNYRSTPTKRAPKEVAVSEEQLGSVFIAPHPITVRVAQRNEKVIPAGSSHDIKTLLPSDLEETLYDDRHHAVMLRLLFLDVFTREFKAPRFLNQRESKSKKQHSVTGRAIRNYLLWGLLMTVVCLAVWLYVDSSRTLTHAAITLVGALLGYLMITTVILWRCLVRTRLVVTTRIIAAFRDTLPWMPERYIYVYSITITETGVERGILGKRLGYGHQTLETTEQNPKLTNWPYARNPLRLDYALQAVSPTPHTGMS